MYQYRTRGLNEADGSHGPDNTHKILLVGTSGVEGIESLEAKMLKAKTDQDTTWTSG